MPEDERTVMDLRASNPPAAVDAGRQPPFAAQRRFPRRVSLMNHDARIALLVVSCVLAGSAKAAKIQKETIPSGGKERSCHVYRPDGVPQDTKTPLVILLHGSGRDGSSLTNAWRDLADEKRILLAAPDALDRSGWRIPDDGPQLLADVVAHGRLRHSIDPHRIYLFGHSAGAVFALSMAVMESDSFAAAAAHAGAFRDATDAAVLAFAGRKVPVCLISGTKDELFPMEKVSETKAAFEAKKFPVTLLELPGYGHDYYEHAEEINRKAWEFLSAHAMEREPRYKPYTIR